jgi:hypothetical protein
MRRIYLVLLAAIAAFGLAACGGASKDFVWQRVDTTVAARANGSLGVTETLTLRYTGGPFTFAFRDLPERRLDGISNISLSDGERAYRQVDDEESREPFTFSIFEEDGAQRVRWVYPETTSAERTFVLRYDVAGAVRRYDNFDQIWWSFAFPGRDEPIEQATGRLTLPAAVPADRLDASAPDWPATVERGAGEVVVQGADVPHGEELTLRVDFPKGVVGGAMPAWQAAADAQDAYDTNTRPTVNVILSALAAGLLVILGALAWGWWRRNRDPQAQGFAAHELPSPPDDLVPAMAGRLLGQPGGQALLGTVLDLANRGLLILREERGGKQLALARTDAPAEGLAPFEQATLDALEIAAPGSEVSLKSASTSIIKAQSRLDAQYTAALVERGDLDRAGLAGRRAGFVAGSTLLAVGVAGFIPAAILAQRYSVWLPVVAGVVALAGLGWLIAAASVRGVTPKGADAVARWEAFKRYLGRVRSEHAPAGQFELLLPYAVAFGQIAHLTKSYAAAGEPLPVWYYPAILSHGGAGGGASGMNSTLLLHDFSQNFIAAMSSAGGSAGGGSAGGGGGASGGGGGGAG